MLADPSDVPLSAVALGRPLDPLMPVPDSRQRLERSDEPLVVVDSFATLDAYGRLGILEPRPCLVRLGVERRLRDARSALPEGFEIVVLDGWRSLADQQQLLHFYGSQGPTQGFVASVDPAGMRPPHVTGGAVDLTLAWGGRPLAMGTDFDSFDDAARLDAFEAEDGIVRRLRRLLASVMFGAGFAAYAPEWWHWSFGDDVWAAANHRPAIYDEYEAQSVPVSGTASAASSSSRSGPEGASGVRLSRSW